MLTYIRQPSAQCSLGGNLEACVSNLLQGGLSASQQAFNNLQEPLQIPYFASASGLQPEGFYQHLNRFLKDILERAQLDTPARARTALLIGSSSFDVHISEQHYRADLQDRGPESAVPMPIIGYGKLAARLARELGLSPHHYTYSTACTSSANALLYGRRLLQAGLVDHALVLGCEQGNQTSQLGFYGLGLVSPAGEIHPFDTSRDGLVLGEGLGALLLSHSQHTPAHERRWQLLGGAIGTDNHSLTAAHTSGEELTRVIRHALSDSGINTQDIDFIKAHGTASLKNDEAEAAALLRVFNGQVPPMFALKPYCGHTLGASGALELALTLGALKQGTLPANTRLRGEAQLGIELLQHTIAARPAHYLINCFAFGGNNNALVISDSGQSQ